MIKTLPFINSLLLQSLCRYFNVFFSGNSGRLNVFQSQNTFSTYSNSDMFNIFNQVALDSFNYVYTVVSFQKFHSNCYVPKDEHFLCKSEMVEQKRFQKMCCSGIK